MEKLNKEWLAAITGDPFADTGAWAIETFSKEHPGEEILQLIERVAKIYINDWEAKINPFFLNSTITQPAFKGERKLTETLDYFQRILNDREPSIEGVCRILGQRTRLFPAGRNNHIMSGSGTFINFHHTFEPGLMLSKEILIRMFFVPLGSIFIGNRVAVLGCNTTELEKRFVQKIVWENLKRIGAQSSTGIYKSPYGYPANTLFESINEWNADYNFENDAGVEMTLYHFTNFGASPEITIYTFSARLFTFYRKVTTQFKYTDNWKKFVRSFARPPKGISYREQEDEFIAENKSGITKVDSELQKGFYNIIYTKLLAEANIRSLMVGWCRSQYENHRKIKFFHIASLYQIFLRDMKEETLQKIEHIADVVVSNDDKRKNWLNKLLLVKNESTFRDFLIILMKAQNSQGEIEPVLRLRDYDQYFLSAGVYAKETRDLILIAIFEKLSERNIVEDIKLPEEFNDEAE